MLPTRLISLTTVALVIAATAMLLGAHLAAAAGSPPHGPATARLLSNERTFTRWAYARRTAPVHRRPMARSRRVARLRWETGDGFDQSYLVLRSRRDAAGRDWVRVRVPMRPNGTTGWVRRRDLGAFHLTHQEIVVDRRRLRIRLYRFGRLIWSAPVAVGKSSTPTPAGHFWIEEWFKVGDRRSGYWPYALGTSDYSRLTDWPGGGIIGIHGPYHEPAAIPGRVSHGCIRLRVGDDAWLARRVGIGTPLRVR